jgi:hypothetical protein
MGDVIVDALVDDLARREEPPSLREIVQECLADSTLVEIVSVSLYLKNKLTAEMLDSVYKWKSGRKTIDEDSLH